MARADRRRPALLLVLLALVASSLALAALPDSVASRLATLPPPLQQQLRARGARLEAMSAAQRATLEQRMAAWDALPRAEQRERRERWLAWRALPPAEQWQVRTAAQQFATLPPEQQQALQARFAQLDAGERRGWLLGPVLGADYPGLRPLLLQVPPEQREPLLATLREMSPGERADLAVLAQRVAPPQRDALRRDLLSTAAANRAAWLGAQLRR